MSQLKPRRRPAPKGGRVTTAPVAAGCAAQDKLVRGPSLGADK
jgi:hypothetical protein